MDIVLAALHGTIPSAPGQPQVLDPRLLATAAALRATWAAHTDPLPGIAQKTFHVNETDSPDRGPLLGRYPGDKYDGDGGNEDQGHPWALCTAAVAELYYRVAAEIRAAGTLAMDKLAAPFYAQVNIDSTTPLGDAIIALRTAGDRMIASILYHSDHLELSEQYDAWDGFEKSVQNLTWSYASVLSALRARTTC
jgi:glucoamylase